MAKKKETTIDQLARMVQKGFESTASKEDLRELRTDFDGRFEIMQKRLDRIENLLITSIDRRFERIEDTIRLVKTKLRLH